MAKDTANNHPTVNQNGLIEKKDISGESLKSLGMDSVGKNQMPQGIAKSNISTDRGKFEWC
jgi:hypothetical protein|tara:strand:- start:1396 stop:1578 length:183 start_codon:yes stop_codon:yes gene_type:complete